MTLRQYIALISGVILILAMMLAIFYHWTSVWEFSTRLFKEEWKSAVVAFLAAVIGSLCAALFLLRFDTKFWRDDIAGLSNSVEAIEEQVTGWERNILTRFPEAIGGRFTRSLFEYYPLTGAGVAKILSEQVEQLYRYHHERVSVTQAGDTYKLASKFKDIGGVPFWHLMFESTWTWLNDSKGPRQPFLDLLFILTVDETAFQGLLAQEETALRRLHRKEFFRFIEGKNVVRSILVNPDASTAVQPDDVDKLFKISHVSLEIGSELPIDYAGEDLVVVAEKELPKYGVYRAWRLEPHVARRELGQDQVCTIRYRGELCLPVFSPAGQEEAASQKETVRWGQLAYPPSDLIQKEYTIKFIWPEEVKPGRLAASFIEDASGWRRLYPSAREGFGLPKLSSVGDLPKGLALRDGESLRELRVEGPLLPHLDKILVVWAERLGDG